MVAAAQTVHQLPSYTPDCNPIEHLWRNFKRAKTHNRYFPTFEALVEAVNIALTAFGGEVREVHCNTCEGAHTALCTFLRCFQGVHKA